MGERVQEIGVKEGVHRRRWLLLVSACTKVGACYHAEALGTDVAALMQRQAGLLRNA